VNGRIVKKRIHVRIEHVKRSRCREEVLNRVRQNEELKAKARETGGAVSSTHTIEIFSCVEKVDLKRKQAGPRPELMLSGVMDELVTVAPIPYDIVKEGIVA